MVKFDGYDYDALSVEVWNDNYRHANETTRVETWNRVAESCASIEKEEIRKDIIEKFQSILYNDKFVPGGRILSNIGNNDRKGTTLFNCYVHNPKDIGLKDCDSIDGIYDMLKAQAKTLQSEGGYGINGSWLRPAGAYIEGIGSRTPGPIKFMELWDKSSEIITVGSTKIRGERKKSEKTKIRKGAMMLVLNVWHPDIKEFITAKQTPGVLTKFNMSVGITEGFMSAVINDLNWELKYPDTTHPQYKEEWFGFIEEWEAKGYPTIVYETVKAKDIWNLIMESTYNRAEPGVLFLDTYNKLNPLYYAEKIATTNPCFRGSERLLTDVGYVSFYELYSSKKPVKIITDDRVKFVGTPEDEKWEIFESNVGVSVRQASEIVMTSPNEKIYKLTFSNGSSLQCTSNHHIATTDGMIMAEDLTYNMNILTYNFETNEQTTTKLVSYEFVCEEPVYCLQEEITRSCIVNGIVARRCGEIGMATGVCNLGSINLVQFVKDVNGKLEFDFVEFENVVKISVRFLDNVNSISTTPLPEYDKSVEDRRRIGLGVLGLGSLHMMLGIPFGSSESLELQEKIAKLKCETELLASAELGKEKGSFKLFDKEKYFNSYYFNELSISEDVKNKIVEIGEMRNSHQSMNAPTGNTGIYARNVSGGIEPVFSIEGYSRWCIVPEFRQRELIDSGIVFPNVHKSEWFETDIFKFSTRGTEQILKGTIGDKNYEIDKSRGLVIENYVEDFGIKFAKKYYSTKFESMKSDKIFKDVSTLSVDDHVNSLKIWAKYSNMSISKTVNLPNDYPYDKFQNVYMDAWKNNIKGITTYREGTMTAVLETKDSKKNVKEKTSGIVYSDAPKRPETLECDIHQVKIKGESWTIFVGKLDGMPYEIFGGSEKYIKIPKVYNKGILQKATKKNDMNSRYDLYYGEEGKETIIKDIVSVFENPLYNYHTRSLSMKLRHGIPTLFIVEMLQRDELGSELYSFNKVIARVLKTYIKDGTKKKGICPNCGGEHLVMQEGCFVCQDCSYSKCS
jgi:ribonucleotide reductase alpha subunit